MPVVHNVKQVIHSFSKITDFQAKQAVFIRVDLVCSVSAGRTPPGGLRRATRQQLRAVRNRSVRQ